MVSAHPGRIFRAFLGKVDDFLETVGLSTFCEGFRLSWGGFASLRSFFWQRHTAATISK